MVRRTRRKPVSETDPIRAVIYTRLSKAKTGDTRDTAERNTEASLETQRAGCERQIAALGGVVVGTETDTAAGDRLDNRAGLFRAIDRIRSGDANTLIVHSLERFSRDPMQQGAVTYMVRQAGGRLLSATETIQNSGPLGDAVNILLGVSGAIELARIRERTNRAFDAKFRQTERYKPSHRPPYGYRKIGSGAMATYEIDPTESLIVRRIYDERAAGKSLRVIATGLNADSIATPTGRGTWGASTLVRILDRPVYVTGEHECWVTKVVRDGDNIPMQEPRPIEERYTVTFPAFIDAATAQRAAATDERNTWSSARHDRPAETGIGRYGFFRCGGCGRALSVMSRGKPKGLPRYACSGHTHKSRPCRAKTSISVHLLDQPVWWWIQAVIENPARADAWRVVHQPPVVDEMAVQALIEAEETVRELEARSLQLLDKLAMLEGPAARLAADRLNSLNADIDAATAQRDRLAAATAQASAAPVPTILATDALSAATYHALEAMNAADPTPERTHTIEVHHPDGIQGVVVPDSWKAKRAAMAALGVTVTVYQEAADAPRWVAEMRLPGGTVIRGHELPTARGFTPPEGFPTYLFPSSP